MRTWLFACMAFAGACGVLAAQPLSNGAFEGRTRFMEKDGEAVFAHVCVACHMPDAKGATGAARYPSLASDTKLATRGYPVFMVVNGRGTMPAFARQLSDEQIASVVNYVRTNFGNAYSDAVTPDEVRMVRP